MGPALRHWGAAVCAAALVALGVFMAIDIAGMHVSPTYARVGPRLVPWMIAGGLIAVGTLLLVGVWRHSPAAEPPPEDDVRLHWPPLLWIAGGLALQGALMRWAGFVIASALLFALSARAFDSRRPVLDLAVGLVLAVLCYVGFTRGLGIHLPAGLLGGWL